MPYSAERWIDERPIDVTVAAKPRDEAEQRARPTDTEPAPTEEERYAYADSVFESQTYDPTWARESAERLTSVLSILGIPAVRTNSVTCRSSLCRIELAAENCTSISPVRARPCPSRRQPTPNPELDELERSGRLTHRSKQATD